MTPEHIEYLRKDSSSRCWMKNVELSTSHFVLKSEVPNYLLSGYELGRFLDQSGDKNPIHNHEFTEEECQKRSVRVKGEWDSGSRKHATFYMTKETYKSWCNHRKCKKGSRVGKHLTKEISRKGGRSAKGKVRINNGFKNTFALPG